MNRNVNVFIAVVLCMGLCGGLIWMHTANDENLGWNIQDFYEGASESSSGAAYTNATFSGSADGGSLSMPMLSSRSLRRSVGVSSQPIANSLSPLTSSPLTSSPTAGGAMYATSSQTYKSFGGGMYAGASQVSNSRSANSPSPIANGAAALSIAPISYTSLRGTSNNPQEVLSNADIAAVMSASAMNGFSVYGGLSTVNSQLSTDCGSYNPISSGNTYQGIGGRQKSAINFDDVIVKWLQDWLDDKGILPDTNGQYTISEGDLYRAWLAYLEAQGSSPGGMSWDQFRAWFDTAANKHTSGGTEYTTYNLLPVGSGLFPLALMALVYALYLFLKRRINIVK